MKPIQAFISLSRFAGMREDWVQAGGGNTSVKLGGTVMRIKSSGALLSEVTEEYGFADVNYIMVRDSVVQGEPPSGVAIESARISGGKPSIETFLHALAPCVYTLHTHPLAFSMLACRKNGMDTLAEMFPNAVRADYAKPGYPLASLLNEAVKNSGFPARLLFLQSHGMVVSGDTSEEVIAETESVLRKIESGIGVSMDAYRAATDVFELLNASVGFSGVVYYCRDNILEDLRGESFDFAYSPDCVVYCGKKMLLLSSLSEFAVREFFEQNGKPAVISYNGHYYAAADTMRKAREIESLLSFAARIFVDAREEAVALPEAERSFLLNWDAEKYRRDLK